MGYLRMERIDPQRNRYRYYVTAWQPTLWGGWSLVRCWGRIGEEARGERICECADLDEALCLAAQIIDLRLKHGYVIKNH